MVAGCQDLAVLEGGGHLPGVASGALVELLAGGSLYVEGTIVVVLHMEATLQQVDLLAVGGREVFSCFLEGFGLGELLDFGWLRLGLHCFVGFIDGEFVGLGDGLGDHPALGKGELHDLY